MWICRRIHTNVDPRHNPPADFPASIPAAGGTRSVAIHSQSDIAGIGSWRADLSVSRSDSINVRPVISAFTVNGNSRLNHSRHL